MPEIQLSCPVCTANHPLELTEAQYRSEEPFLFKCSNLDRRYRLAAFYVDTRRSFYNAEDLKDDLGPHDIETKFERWSKIDYPPIGLIDEYPAKIKQIINTYSMGYAYPAVTASCCLAERILNRLVLRTRDHFKERSEYKKIYRKDSFDDWNLMLTLVADWALISDKAIDLFRELMPIRHQSIHYKEGYDFEAVAPVAVNKLIAAVSEVFGVINRKDIYLVFDVPGEVWLRSEAESLPFVKEFVIPHCHYTHAVYDIDFQRGIITERLGKTGSLTDAEFVELRKSSSAA